MRDRLVRLARLGLAAGAVEFALRSAPEAGLSPLEQITFLTVAMAAGLVLLVVAAVSPKRFIGLGLGLTFALHVCVNWRLENAVNQPWSEVLAPLLALAVGAVMSGLALDRILQKVERFAIPIAGLAAAAGLVLGMPPGASSAEGPNLLLITLDTTRADRLSPYGGPADTPHLQRLADEGVVFEQAIATAPLTEPSHLSILTGLRTTTTGVLANGTPLGPQPLFSTLLQEDGARTGAVVSGFPLHSRWGWNQGFDVYDDDFGRVSGMHALSLVKAMEQVVLRTNLRERPGTGAVRRSTTFLNRYAEGRFFLWLHLFDPHAPYDRFDVSTAPTNGEPLDLPAWWPEAHRKVTDADWLVRAYDAELAHTDALVGQVLDQLPANTLVIVVADHGESLTEHGYLFEHGDHLYDPSLHVPLIVWWPEQVPAGVRVPCQVSTVDIAPTVAEWFDLPLETHDGRSLAPRLDGACSESPAVATTLGARHVDDPPVHTAVRTSEQKYIETTDGPLLFDLVADPDELYPIQDAALLDEGAALLEVAVTGRSPVRQVEIDVLEAEALRALGYLD